MSEAVPEGFPASTADLQLVLCLVAQEYPDSLILMIQRMYREYWAEGNSSSLTPEGFSGILAQELGSQRAERVLALVSFKISPLAKSLSDHLFLSRCPGKDPRIEVSLG